MIEVLKGIIALFLGGPVLLAGIFSIFFLFGLLFFCVRRILERCSDLFIPTKEVVIKVTLLIPIHYRARHRCPFYGFNHNGEFSCFNDSMGNQCAVIRDEFAPCQMEWRGETPNWSECPFNHPKNQKRFESIGDSYKVFPREFEPKGLPFGKWLEYVMSQKPESVRED